MTTDPLFLWDFAPAGDTLQGRFEVWLAANGHVYDAFRRAALALKERGRQHYGAKAICEELRFHSAVYGVGDEFKINNIYTSRLARKLLEECPELTGFLELRRLQRE